MIVVAAELTLGVLQGIALGVVLSLPLLIYRSSAVTFPGLLIWRPGGDLWFASIGHLGDGLKAALAASHPPAKRVLVDAEAVNLIDVSACDALLTLIRELQSQGITFAFARVRDHVRERMRLGGVEAVVGSTNFHERETDGVHAWQQHEAPGGAISGRS
jgi:MFS superfamily sulfate permease-like transporter